MADLSQKKSSYVRRYVAAVEAFLIQMDDFTALESEWSANAYPTGADPASNNITDTDLLMSAPWITATQLNQAIAAIHSINDSVATNRGYLEAIRS